MRPIQTIYIHIYICIYIYISYHQQYVSANTVIIRLFTRVRSKHKHFFKYEISKFGLGWTCFSLFTNTTGINCLKIRNVVFVLQY